MRIGYGRAPRMQCAPGQRPAVRSYTKRLLISTVLLVLACDGTDVFTPKSESRPQHIQIEGDRYWTDWSEYATGVQPAGFSQMWDPSPHFKVVLDSSGTGKLLEWSAPRAVSRNRFALAYDGAGDLTDQSVYTEFRVRSLAGSASAWYFGAAAVRISGTASAEGGYALWFVVSGTQHSVSLSTYTNGGYTQLASHALSWTLDTWYSVRFEAIGTTIRARIWVRGTAEPQHWDIEKTHAAWPAGRPGVANHDNGVVQWDFWEARGTAAVVAAPSLTQLILLPENITLATGENTVFTTQGLLSNGSSITVPVTYTATGGAISTSGVYTAGPTPGTYQVIATHQGIPALADTAVVIVTAPLPGVTLTMGFTTDVVGAHPAGWTETAYPGGSAWTVAADAGVSDGRVLRNVTTGTGRHILRLDATSDTTTTQEIVVRMRMADADGRGPGVALRHSMSGSSESAYVAYLRPTNGTVEVNRFMNGAWLFVGQANVTNQPGKWYWIRFRAEGNALKVKVWNDGTAEPAGWTREFTDSGLATGSAGLYTYEPNTVDYDGVGFAAGGATAPTPADGPPPPKTLVNVVVTPAAVNVVEGGIAQFSVHGRWSDGDSTTVPVTWQASGGTITAAGLFTANAAAGTYQVIATHALNPLADTSIVTITSSPPVPPEASVFGTEFNTDPLAQLPTGWTPTAYPSNSTWQVAAENTATDGRVLRNVATTTGRHILRFDAVSDSATTQEVLVKMRFADHDNRGPGVALRHRMNGTLESAYVAYLRPGTNLVEINRFLNGQWLFVGAASFVNTPGNWYWIRFRAEGTALRVKVWADGTTEPVAWTHVANDAGIAAGSVGLYTYEPNTVMYDQFGYALGGAAALRIPLLQPLIGDAAPQR